MKLTDIALWYVVFINAWAFTMYGIDKYKAKHGLWRIPEAALLLVAAVGGSVGAWCGMQVFHHKTRKPKFSIGVPVIFVVEVVLLVYGFRFIR
mgnify:FL=1